MAKHGIIIVILVQRHRHRHYHHPRRHLNLLFHPSHPFDSIFVSTKPVDKSSNRKSLKTDQLTIKYFPANGTAIRTYYNEDDKQVMDIHPNQYVIQVTEMTTTTTPRPQPVTTDCPPFHPCNTVVYQQTTQCCKCYLVPNRCCSCDYSNNRNNK